MQWKIASGIIFCSVVFFAASGCRPAPSAVDVSVPDHSGIELRIACASEEAAALLRSPAHSWGQRVGAKVTLRVLQVGLQPSQDEAPIDVLICRPADLPHWAAAGELAPLPGSYRAHGNPFTWNDLLPAYREQLTLWDGKVYGLPVVGEAPLCCYRADLLKSSAHQAALRGILGPDLDGPASWEQFAQIAEYFRTHGVEGKPGPSLPPLPRADADLDRLFYTVAAGFARRAIRDDLNRRDYQESEFFSFHYDSETGEPRIAAPGFVHALKLLQRLQACRPPESADHPEEAFRAGRAVLCLTDASWLVTFQRTPALRDKVSICRVPGGEHYFDYQTGQKRQPPHGAINRVPYLGAGGWMAVVLRSSSNVEAAFDLLTDLAGTKTSMQIFLGNTGAGGPTRTGQLYRHRWDSFDLDDPRATQLRDVLEETLLHRNLKNPALCLRTPRQADHRAILVRCLREALLKGADAEKTLKNVAEEWKKLDREQGLPEHLADYRRSLGLLAK